MLDRPLHTLINPLLRAAAAGLVRRGVSADAVTWAGFALGAAAAACIAQIGRAHV